MGDRRRRNRLEDLDRDLALVDPLEETQSLAEEDGREGSFGGACSKAVPPVRSRPMAWVKVPPENHPIFHEALPKDPRVETLKMFGGVAAKVNGHIFAGLFGRSTMVWLPEADRAAALSLEGAAPFDPMGDGRARSDKVMLPESLMEDPPELRHWIARAFRAAAALPEKAAKTAPARKPAKPSPPKTRTAAKAPVGKRPSKK